MARSLVIAAAKTPLSAAREVAINGLGEAEALDLAKTLIVPFLRTTGGNVSITWRTGY